MLSGPRALASASETSDYLLHEYLVRNDKAHRTANRWHGGGAEALGLPERVSRRRFVEVLEGHVPGTDIRLGRVVDGAHQHRPGWDCTFSAPKSVSLEALLHDNKAVMRAHDASVRAALDWMEAEFLQTRGYDPATGRRPRVAERRPANVATVALANKMARTIWALLAHDRAYHANFVCRAA